MRKASSFGVSTSRRKRAPESCSRGRTFGLAAAGVEQDADGQRQVLLLGEALDGLRIVVLGHLAVVFAQVGDEAVLVARGEVDVDQVDVDLQRGGVGTHGLRGGRCLAGRRWCVGRGGLLGAQPRGRPQEHERQDCETAQRHEGHTPY